MRPGVVNGTKELFFRGMVDREFSGAKAAHAAVNIGEKLASANPALADEAAVKALAQVKEGNLAEFYGPKIPCQDRSARNSRRKVSLRPDPSRWLAGQERHGPGTSRSPDRFWTKESGTQE